MGQLDGGCAKERQTNLYMPHLKDLNMAIQREHSPLLTIEEIATRLHGVKVFIVLDAWHGFWHVLLDEASSFLTTFNTPIWTMQVEENAPLESVLALRFFSARWMRLLKAFEEGRILWLWHLETRWRRPHKTMIKIWMTYSSAARREISS